MFRKVNLPCLAALAVVCSPLMLPGISRGEVEILGAQILPDVPFPEHLQFWFEDQWARSGGSDESLCGRYDSRPRGCNVHVWFRGTNAKVSRVEDVLLEGISLKRALAFSDQRVNRKPASIYFAGLPSQEVKTLEDAGEPVWWRVEPEMLGHGAPGELLLRLRRVPTGGRIQLQLESGGKHEITVAGSVQDSGPRIEGISVAPDRCRVHLYVSRLLSAGAPKEVRINGKPLHRLSWRFGDDGRVGIVPFVLRLNELLQPGGLRLFEVEFENGTAAAVVRVFPEEGFAYGIWGGPPGKKPDAAAARAHVRNLHEHGINVQMPQVGSPMLAEFYASAEGQQLCDSLGLKRLVNDPGKWGTREPYAYFIHDEPDCGDYRMTGLAAGHQVGSLAQWAVGRSAELRRADSATPQLLNVDMTFKPDNWYTYGQLPDIFSADPYYQVRLWESYGKHPERRPLYEKAMFVYAVGEVCRAACAPKPLHVVLYACRRGGRADEAAGDQINVPAEGAVASRAVGGGERALNAFHRFPTPQEKRIEVYYALAAGAKGLSYWWFTPGGGQSEGVGSNDPAARALWEEIGRLGAEMRIAAPVLARSCPAGLECRPSPGVWVRTLVAGIDTVIVLIVNDQYRCAAEGIELRPVEDAKVRVDLPAWLKAADTFEVGATGTGPVQWAVSGRETTVSLGRLETTRMVVVTSDANLRGELERRAK